MAVERRAVRRTASRALELCAASVGAALFFGLGCTADKTKPLSATSGGGAGAGAGVAGGTSGVPVGAPGGSSGSKSFVATQVSKQADPGSLRATPLNAPTPSVGCGASTRGVPSGWQPHTLYNSRCVFVPPSDAALPPPLVWQDCAVKAPSVKGCRELAITWETDDPLNVTGGEDHAVVEADGTVVLELRNMYIDNAHGLAAAMDLVAEADGRVRQALWDPYDDARTPPFWLLGGGVTEGKATWALYEYTSSSSATARRGAFGGNDEVRVPPVIFPLDAGRGVAVPGPSYYAESVQPLHVWGWDGRDYGKLDGSDEINQPAWAGDVLYWSRELGSTAELRIWTKERGSTLLRGFGQDRGRAAAHLGTDGKDMVWLEGSGRDDASPDSTFPTRAIYTAPFTTDPEKLAPRRLRSWLPEDIQNSHPPAVGCGMAALWAPRSGNARDPYGIFHDILLVRLSDGVAWRIESPATYDFGAAWTTPLALTCHELFAVAGLNYRRVRIDALDEGLAPD